MAVPTQVCTVQDKIVDTVKWLNERAPFALPFADLLDNQKQFTIRLLEAVIPNADGASA